jgi:transposase
VYALVGVVFALPASHVHAWRLAAWGVSGVAYSGTFASYDTLNVEGYEGVRINRQEELADSTRHINGMENVWSQAKRHQRQFNGVPKASFPLFLQECVWRFNTGTPEKQLESLRKLHAAE